MDSLQYWSLKRTIYRYSSYQKGCIVRYLQVVDVLVTFIWDEPLFIFWYEEYVVLSALRHVSKRCSCMHEDNFFQLLFVSCVWNYIVGRTLHCAALHDSGTLYRALIIVQTGHFCSLMTVKRMATRCHDPWKQVVQPGRELCGWIAGIWIWYRLRPYWCFLAWAASSYMHLACPVLFWVFS